MNLDKDTEKLFYSERIKSFHELLVKTKFFPFFSAKFFKVINTFNQRPVGHNPQYKSYPLNKSWGLNPGEAPEALKLLSEEFQKRSSVVRFDKKTLPWETLSTLLTNLQGELRERPGHYLIPSAGHRKSLEVYFWANNIENLEKGIYHFNIDTQSIALVVKDVDFDKIKEVFPGGGEDFENCMGLFFITSVFDKVVAKYRNRSLRFIFTEAGLYLDRLWLITNILGLEGSALGGGYDDKLCRLLRLNGIEEGPVGCFILGYRAPKS